MSLVERIAQRVADHDFTGDIHGSVSAFVLEDDRREARAILNEVVEALKMEVQRDISVANMQWLHAATWLKTQARED